MSDYANATIYSCQIYDNGTLIRDYVPCINPSGEVGLYDLVTAAFFGNSGTGVFIAGTPVVSLPEGYTQVEYLESTGTQYVNTDFIPDQDTKLVMVAMPSTIANAAASNGFVPYGSGNSSTDGAFECYTWNSNHEANYDGQRSTLGAATASVLVAISHDKNSFVLSDATGTVFTNEFTYSEFTSPRALTLFAANRASLLKGLQNIYLCLLFDNGTLVRCYIPCINAAGEAGLYDLAGAKFYGNAGSGVFVTGPEVYGVEYDPYLWYEVDSPTTEQMTVYLLNVSIIRSVLAVMETTPEVPADMVELMVQEANDIEVILLDVYRQLNIMATTFIPCGEALCGGDNL